MRDLVFVIAKLYVFIYVIIKKMTGVNIPGLGFLLRRVGHDRVFEIHGQKMWFNHKVASPYGLLVAGVWQEPETHKLIGKVMAGLNEPAAFVDVGANIGAMMIDTARYEHVHCYGFEPSGECIRAIRTSMRLNGKNNFTLYQNLVGDCPRMILFAEGQDVGAASVHSDLSKSHGMSVRQVTLDESLVINVEHVVLLIDVEGYEPQVLKGGAHLIRQKRPLIIFEYNFVSKQHYQLKDIQHALGADYTLFRLRKDATLDGEVGDAWNCVAVPNNSPFEKILNNVGSFGK